MRLSHKKITEVIAKVDEDYITELQMHSAGKEISAFYYQTGVNHQVQIGRNGIIGVYGVKGK